jgi:hypothetical protein
MVPSPRPKPRTPAERAEELAAIQRRLKQEAAERRETAAAKPAGPRARDVTGRGRTTTRPVRGRRTP